MVSTSFGLGTEVHLLTNSHCIPFRHSNAKAKESQQQEETQDRRSEKKLTVVLPDSVNAVSGDTNDSKVESYTLQSSENFNKSANGDHESKKSDRSGRKLTTLLREDISNEIEEEEEKSLEEEKRAVIEACRYSPSSLCQLVRIDKQKFIRFTRKTVLWTSVFKYTR